MITVQDLINMSDSEIKNFIRQRLMYEKKYAKCKKLIREGDDNFDDLKNHHSFTMSGYDDGEVGRCQVDTNNILNKFAYLGIYDYTSYLFLDFYKGCGTLYFKYWGEDVNREICLGGYGTVQIIFEIFGLTIFSNEPKRRRK